MTIAQRLYLLIGMAFLGLAAIAGLGVIQINKVYEAANYANVNTVPSLTDLNNAAVTITKLRVMTYRYVTAKDPNKRRDLEIGMIDRYKKITEMFNLYEKQDLSDDKDKALLENDRIAFKAFGVMQEQVIGLMKQDKADEALDVLFKSVTGVVKSMDIALEEHAKYNADLGKKGADDGAAALKHANMMALTIALLTVLVVITLGVFITRKIVGSLNEAIEISETVAAGDLTRDIIVTSNDETGRLLRALKAMSDSLKNIVGEVRTGTEQITAASTEIATGNLDLSSRTEEQASSLEETASAMEELTSTVKQNADNAR
ncbi:MCP four helix bundle domain-containing protein [Undibacterium sp. 5I1]|uniref:methyl-accepting chemotaxis protein n=1 Tax=unclassified Undibacterium TaxID=2630295 RepID=UPI002AB4DA8E|nr:MULTISPECIES: MCP four helix bundle domain-containing protein [unclassified Undibacterium]MDY7538812.1 MCP four helix bundle domain-containing protein [Undibacterium sp. 5I1]